MSSKAVGLKVEGQRRVGLIQEQVNPGQLDAVPLKHGAQDLTGGRTNKKQPLVVGRGFNYCCSSSPGAQPHPKVFFFMAGTISVLMSTLRSNLRLKHSLLGSCSDGWGWRCGRVGGGDQTQFTLHRWGQKARVKNIWRLSDTMMLRHT